MILGFGLLSLSGAAAQEAAPWPTTGWLTATPESQGLDSALLAGVYESIAEKYPNYHSLLVIRHGYLVAEMYRYPYSAETLHDQRSITKSNTATLTGIAVADGAIAGIDAPLLSFFPNQNIANVDERKEAVTVGNLLTMTSGLEWDENSSIGRMVFTSDWTAWMLDRAVTREPGTRFNYCSGCSNLLAALVENATGQPLAEYAAAKLYSPLGITNFQWDREPGGHTTGGFGLHMAPRDMAKLGYLYLHQGEWDGAQIVPADWVAAATAPQAPVSPADGFNYGYQWWLPATDEAQAYYFAAQGYGGQTIYVRPDLDLIVVATAGGIDFGRDTFPLISEYIVPAAADAPLPENPDALARLQAAIDSLQQPQPSDAAELPATAAAISGKYYDFGFPPFYSGWKQFDWQQMGLAFEQGSPEAALLLTLDNDQSVELPIGLDGLPRLTELPGFGLLSLQGSWTAPDSFKLGIQILGLPEDYSLLAQFTDAEMHVVFQEALGGDMHALVGRLGG